MKVVSVIEPGIEDINARDRARNDAGVKRVCDQIGHPGHAADLSRHCYRSPYGEAPFACDSRAARSDHDEVCVRGNCSRRFQHAVAHASRETLLGAEYDQRSANAWRISLRRRDSLYKVERLTDSERDRVRISLDTGKMIAALLRARRCNAAHRNHDRVKLPHIVDAR